MEKRTAGAHEPDKGVQEAAASGVIRRPFAAYRGDGPYLFISYAHRDYEQVYDLIGKMHRQGYAIWYDEGITPGNEWTDEIARALEHCAAFVLLLSPRSAASENVQNEITFALDEKKPVLVVHLEETELRGGVRLQLSTRQAILKYQMPEEEFFPLLTRALENLGVRPGEEAPTASWEAGPEEGGPNEPQKGPKAQKGPNQKGSKTPGRKRKWPAILVSSVGLCLAVVGLLLRFLPASSPPTEPETSLRAAAAYPETDVSLLQVEVVDGHAEITGFDAGIAHLVIPAAIDGVPVTRIRNVYRMVAVNNALTDVYLPDSLTVVGDYAFSFCEALTQVSFSPATEEIGESAFYDCAALTELSLPENLRRIGEHAFWNCVSLSGITLPSGLTTLESYAFQGCVALESIAIPGSVSSFGEHVFHECGQNLTSVSFGAGLRRIPAWTFYNCYRLTSVSLPAGLEIVREGAFCNCTALKTVSFGGTEAQWKVVMIESRNEPLDSAELRFSAQP